MEPEWKAVIRALLKKRGLTMKAASKAAGQGETFVRDVLERDRMPSIENFAALARVLGTTTSDLLTAKVSDLVGESPVAGRQIIPIMGYVGAGGDVDPDYEQVPPEGLDQYELPYIVGIVSDPIGFRVRGDSMQPKYSDGEILVVEREQPWSAESMIGDFAVVLTHDRRRYVKKIMPGTRPRTFNLVSINAPTIEDAQITWASPVRMVIPDIGLRKIPKPARKSAARAGAPARRK